MPAPLFCWACGHPVEIVSAAVGRQDRCENCQRDLHVCKNCKWYEPGLRNDCREPMTERILDREAANFCHFFVPFEGKRADLTSGEVAKSKAKLDALFSKLK
ncbi:MAG TPA: hypothetical protein VG389_25680 [Myxococcota bacterium]|jgi:hypothetical protein|nr:hypothetical protein [Myxococcota bacterium]